jgi:hypothetical protein
LREVRVLSDTLCAVQINCCACAGLGNQKRKRPKLAALGIKPVRTPEKNTRFLWRADVAACNDGSLGAADQVHIHLAGNGFLYRCKQAAYSSATLATRGCAQHSAAAALVLTVVEQHPCEPAFWAILLDCRNKHAFAMSGCAGGKLQCMDGVSWC